MILCLSSFLDTMLLEGREWEKEPIFMTSSGSGAELVCYLLHSLYLLILDPLACLGGRERRKKGAEEEKGRDGKGFILTC